MSGQAEAGDDALDCAVRLHVLQRAAESARMPQPDEIAAMLNQPQAEVERSLCRLAANHLLVLAPGTTNVWVAPPFCAVPTDFRVHTQGRTYWGVCIWDALGIAAALHADATITTRCGDCGDELNLEIGNAVLARGAGIVHFAVPARRWWDNIAYA